MTLMEEYDRAAYWMGAQGKLPKNLSFECQRMIDDDPDAFEEHVNAIAYAVAMGEDF